MLLNIHKTKHRNIVEFSIISNFITIKHRLVFFNFSLFSQTSAKMLKDPLSKLVFIDYFLFLYLYSLIFFNNTFVIILQKSQTT